MKEKPEKGNLYDRIFKENAESIFIPLIEQVLGLKILAHKPLPSKLNKTLEREVDFLYRIRTDTITDCLLHIEFQTDNDKEMVFRIGEYHALILSKYKLPIYHVVIYLGKRTARMENTLPTAQVYQGFDLIRLYDLDPEEILSSQVPEVVLLAVLSKFPRERAEDFLRLIVRRLMIVASSKAELSRRLNQLIILSRIRNFEKLSAKIIEDMPISYDIEKDALYQRGEARGEAKGEARGEARGEAKEKIAVAHRCYANGLSVEMAANISGLPLEEVEKIYAALGAQNDQH